MVPGGLKELATFMNYKPISLGTTSLALHELKANFISHYLSKTGGDDESTAKNVEGNY